MIDYKKRWIDGEHFECGSLRKYYRYDKKSMLKKILRNIKWTLPYKKTYE